METSDNRPRIDRRVAIRWISSATAAIPLTGLEALAVDSDTIEKSGAASASGYGPDPDLVKVYQPGELWPLTFSDAQRRQMIALCDIIIPADDSSTSASSLGVHDFIDEWISSPYPGQKSDRAAILKGLKWLDAEAKRRGQTDFVAAPASVQLGICQHLAVAARSDRRAFPGSFFQRLRDLVAGGYYTTPEGMRDIGYRGNTAMAEWTGPPPEVLEKLGLPAQ